MDKAGGYAIQGRAGVFIERIEGDYYNVVGLPLATLYRSLRELGWQPRQGRKQNERSVKRDRSSE